MGKVKMHATGVDAIAAERSRQINEEGWTFEHDDMHHTPEELELVAACYATPPSLRGSKMAPALFNHDGSTPAGGFMIEVPAMWPSRWAGMWWKPSEDRQRDLEKAGALMAAAWDMRRRAYTCHGCADVETCEFAWDSYNLDGDCLAVK